MEELVHAVVVCITAWEPFVEVTIHGVWFHIALAADCCPLQWSILAPLGNCNTLKHPQSKCVCVVHNTPYRAFSCTFKLAGWYWGESPEKSFFPAQTGPPRTRKNRLLQKVEEAEGEQCEQRNVITATTSMHGHEHTHTHWGINLEWAIMFTEQCSYNIGQVIMQAFDN